MNWPKHLKARIRLKEPLKKHTTFKIGGPAEFFIEPDDASALKLLLNTLKRDKIPFLLIGSGSNILANDKGVNAAVLRLGSPYFRRLCFKGIFAYAGAGATLNRVSNEAKRRGLSGAEFLAGIPGTIGGALAMNAGIPGYGIGDIADKVTVMDYNGKIKTLRKKEIKFAYRGSSLQGRIILGARLKLAKGSKKEIRDKIRGYIGHRRLTQDSGHYSAGCVFKNPQGNSAGRLIDLCGLKGKRIGGAEVSLKHANFIVNTGDARAKDVFALMESIKRGVKNKSGIILEPEIKIWK